MKKYLATVIIIFSGTFTFAQGVTIIPDSATICVGDSVQLDLLLGGNPCTDSIFTICTSPSVQGIIGTGTTNISSIPSPYYGFYEDGKVQMIYTASELIAAGLNSGEIKEVAFDVVSSGGNTYNNFNIKMGHTNKNNFILGVDTTFIGGLTPVYCKNTYITNTGWNLHPLKVNFNWDGVSNLIVEVCFDNNFWFLNDSVAQTAQPTQRVLYEFADGQIGCNFVGINFSFNMGVNRPNIRFTNCKSIPDTAVYSYSWSPTTGLSNSNIKNPMASPPNTTTYIVTVTDSIGGVFLDTITVTVIICTYTNEYGKTYEIKLFPNPNNGDFTIQKPIGLVEEMEIKIYAIQGKTVSKNIAGTNEAITNIDLSDQQNGIYFVTIKIGDEIFTRKIIKN